MAWYTTYYFQPELNRAPPSSQGSALILHHHKKPFKPLQLTCVQNLQTTKHTLQRYLRPLMGGQKVKYFAEIFMVDAEILYVLVVNISDFFDFF
jgi:hypothetical protein